MPEVPSPPKMCPVCDMAAILGLGTSICESIPTKDGKESCRRTVKEMETGKRKPVETLIYIIKEHGETPVNDSVDRLNIMIKQATEIAAQRS